MESLSFDEAVDIVREKVLRGEQDTEYDHALNTIMVMWDEDRVQQLNSAVVSHTMYEVEPNTLYVLMNPTLPRYLFIKRSAEYYEHD